MSSIITPTCTLADAATAIREGWEAEGYVNATEALDGFLLDEEGLDGFLELVAFNVVLTSGGSVHKAVSNALVFPLAVGFNLAYEGTPWGADVMAHADAMIGSMERRGIPGPVSYFEALGCTEAELDGYLQQEGHRAIERLSADIEALDPEGLASGLVAVAREALAMGLHLGVRAAMPFPEAA